MNSMLDHLPGFSYRHLNDECWTVLEISTGVENITGYKSEAITGNAQLSYAELIHPSDRDYVSNTVKKGLDAQGSFELEYRIITASGEEAFVWEYGKGIYDNGALIEIVGFVSNKIPHSQQRYFDSTHRAIVSLAKSRNLMRGDVNEFSLEITKQASQLLNIDRVSIWLLSEDSKELALVDMYERSTDTHSTGTLLYSTHFPKYFEALVEGRVIAANDAFTDKRTKEFADEYLPATGVKSMLDACIRMSGSVIGVLCLEQTSSREWQPHEMSFAGELTDQVVQAIANRHYLASENKIKEANANNRAKSKLLATISHEIRTPMNGILGMAELLTHTQLNELQNNYLQTIQESGNLLLNVIEDVLLFSKLEAGKFYLVEERTDIKKTFRSIVSLVSVLAENTVELNFIDGHDDFPTALLLDVQRFKQVVINLVGNAIKFTDHGSVTISYGLKNRNQWYFSVLDTGIGIAAEELSKLFKPFEQENNINRDKMHSGTGLGLSISKEIIGLMNGDINIFSEKGYGTEVIVTLPLNICKEGQQQLHGEGRAELKHDLNILVVEDNHVNKKVIKAMLKKLDAVADVCDDGQQALDVVKSRPDYYDLIFMDGEMPVLDGYVASKLIREIVMEKQPYICGLSAHASKEYTALSEEVGMDNYLTKPVQLNQLEEIIRKVMA